MAWAGTRHAYLYIYIYWIYIYIYSHPYVYIHTYIYVCNYLVSLHIIYKPYAFTYQSWMEMGWNWPLSLTNQCQIGVLPLLSRRSNWWFAHVLMLVCVFRARQTRYLCRFTASTLCGGQSYSREGSPSAKAFSNAECCQSCIFRSPHIYIYIYTEYIYIYTYIHIHIVNIYIYTYIYIYLNKHIIYKPSFQGGIAIVVQTMAWAGTRHAYIYKYWVCIHIYIYIHIRIHTYIYVCN